MEFGTFSQRLEWRNSPDKLEQIGVKTMDKIREMIENRIVDAIILGFDTPEEIVALAEEYYSKYDDVGGVQIYIGHKD